MLPEAVEWIVAITSIIANCAIFGVVINFFKNLIRKKNFQLTGFYLNEPSHLVGTGKYHSRIALSFFNKTNKTFYILSAKIFVNEKSFPIFLKRETTQFVMLGNERIDPKAPYVIDGYLIFNYGQEFAETIILELETSANSKFTYMLNTKKLIELSHHKKKQKGKHRKSNRKKDTSY